MKKTLCISIAFLILFSVNSQNCPTSIRVHTSESVTAGDTLVFTVEVKGAANADLTYNWTVSAGWIISGQGTSKIKVNTEGLDNMTSTATVDLGGLPRECTNYASATASIVSAPMKIISGNYTTAKALTDSIQKFIVKTQLKNIEISQTAFVYVYSGATTNPAQLKQIHETIKAAFKKNEILDFQYEIADGGKKKTASFEMYSLMTGSKQPKPSQ